MSFFNKINNVMIIRIFKKTSERCDREISLVGHFTGLDTGQAATYDVYVINMYNEKALKVSN